MADGVVLDLVYEARDVDQELGSQDKIDAWFDAKTRGLNDWQKDELRKQWGTMQRVLSSRSRMERIVHDIVYDFGTKPRLNNGRGTAMLIARSIFEASKYYALFEKTPFKGHCAVITSYNPQAADITLEDTGAASETDKQFIYNLYMNILKDVRRTAGHDKNGGLRGVGQAAFQEGARDDEAPHRRRQTADRFRRAEAAPTSTSTSRCRIMDCSRPSAAPTGWTATTKSSATSSTTWTSLRRCEGAIKVYSSELDHSAPGRPGGDPTGPPHQGQHRSMRPWRPSTLLCEPVPPPRDDEQHSVRFFCGNTEIASDLADREPLRAAFYKALCGARAGFCQCFSRSRHVGLQRRRGR